MCTMCMFICLHAQTHTHTHIYIHTHKHGHTHTFNHVYEDMHTYAARIYVIIYIHISMHTTLHNYIHTYAFTYLHRKRQTCISVVIIPIIVLSTIWSIPCRDLTRQRSEADLTQALRTSGLLQVDRGSLNHWEWMTNDIGRVPNGFKQSLSIMIVYNHCALLQLGDIT